MSGNIGIICHQTMYRLITTLENSLVETLCFLKAPHAGQQNSFRFNRKIFHMVLRDFDRRKMTRHRSSNRPYIYEVLLYVRTHV